MGHEQMQAGTHPFILHFVGQDIIEYDAELWDPLIWHRGIQKKCQRSVQAV